MIKYFDADPTINVESLAELHEALDILHTQVMDNLSDESPALGVLERAMEAVGALFPEPPEKGNAG